LADSISIVVFLADLAGRVVRLAVGQGIDAGQIKVGQAGQTVCPSVE